MAASQRTLQSPLSGGTKPRSNRKKLATLPANAIVSKRPLIRPAIPSPYTGANTPKCVYVSSHTPFLSAVKRVEKLLGFAEKRAMQSAMTLSKQSSRHRGGSQKRKRAALDQEEDEIMDVARLTEQEKAKRRRIGNSKEEDVVVIKGTGKAVQRVLEMGLWFQQREEYVVKLSTGSVGAIDDISVDSGKGLEQQANPDEDLGNGAAEHHEAHGADQSRSTEDVEPADKAKGASDEQPRESSVRKKAWNKTKQDVALSEDLPETRIRYLSVLNVTVSLR